MTHRNTSQDLVLVQTRLPKKVAQKLLKKLKASADVTMAAYIRRVLIEHVQGEESGPADSK